MTITDTVGFIQKLPHGLVDAFKMCIRDSTYAMQAGREVHVMVQPDKISDAQSTVLALSLIHI